jgi:hypothetical protein
MIEKTLQYHTIIAHVGSKRGYCVEMIAGWFRSEPTKIFEIELVAIARKDGQAVEVHDIAPTGTRWSK